MRLEIHWRQDARALRWVGLVAAVMFEAWEIVRACR